MARIRISVLGCGYLGIPLARKLVLLGFKVYGSTTSKDKLPYLEKEGIKAFLIECQPQMTGQNLDHFFQSDILFLNIPFKRNLLNPEFYRKQITSVTRRVDKSPINFVIFASSTSVYPDALKIAKEDVDFLPDNPRAKVLLKIECGLFRNHHFDTTVLRFAGLYGQERQIGHFLSQENINKKNTPVNLVHVDDCVRVILEVIRQDKRGEIFNVCSDKHPSRQEFYQRASDKLGLPKSNFPDVKNKAGKIVSNKKIKKILKFKFKYPDPLKSL